VSLPVHPKLSPADLDKIVGTVSSIVEAGQRVSA